MWSLFFMCTTTTWCDMCMVHLTREIWGWKYFWVFKDTQSSNVVTCLQEFSSIFYHLNFIFSSKIKFLSAICVHYSHTHTHTHACRNPSLLIKFSTQATLGIFIQISGFFLSSEFNVDYMNIYQKYTNSYALSLFQVCICSEFFYNFRGICLLNQLYGFFY